MDYSQFFDHDCNQYDTHLYRVTHGVDTFDTTFKSEYQPFYIAIYDDLYTPICYYVGANKLPIIFNSECSVDITPFAT